MDMNLADQHWAFLPTQPAGRREIRFAQTAVLVSVVIFLVAAPFAKTGLAEVPAFVPMYVAALVLCDLITAILLFGQYRVLGHGSLLAIAGGYLFTASITFAYALIFPGLFSFSVLPVAGAQTSSAMYMFWHSGFPLVVIAYAFLKSDADAQASMAQLSPARLRARIMAVTAGVLLVVIGFTLFATWGQDSIPIFLDGNHTTGLGHTFLASVWALSLAALLTLWMRKPHTVLDMWLLVVMCVWLCDIALAAILNTGRYDLGWYVGRIYGLLAASVLLIVLLLENARHYGQLVSMSVELTAANKELAQLSMQDGLTGLANRRCFNEVLETEWRRAQRQGDPLALAMFDVDFFKQFNDHYGHVAGDACLRAVAQVMKKIASRAGDCIARYGGEEFALICPATKGDGAVRLAELVCAALEEQRLLHALSPFGHVTLSVGVSSMVPAEGQHAELLIKKADAALYEAKGQGRNQVVAARD